MHDIVFLPQPENRHAPRNILLLQGLVGPFFRRIAKALRKEGFGVFRVNFNGGDRLFWAGCGGGIDYTGNQADWPHFLTRIILRNHITDVVLFGDCRPLHQAAIKVCRDLQIPVHVFDEGYIRPDWITFERGGVNGHSRLPKDPDYYLAQAKTLGPLLPHLPLPSSFQTRAREVILYEAANFFMRWRFRHWKTHRPWNAIQEGAGWLRRLSRRKAALSRSAAIFARLKTGSAPYMLFPLQLDSDSQIRFHSPFPSMQAALEDVMKSFAAHAAPPLRLVVKEHPLDNGLTHWRKLVMKMAASLSVADRVDYIETGDVALIVAAAKGVVTINSTTGTLALAKAVPVITLGQAVYNIPGITSQEKLANFWNAPGQPDLKIFVAFRRVLIDRCLIPGGFFSNLALDVTVRGVVERFKSTCSIKPAYFFEQEHFQPRLHARISSQTPVTSESSPQFTPSIP